MCWYVNGWVNEGRGVSLVPSMLVSGTWLVRVFVKKKYDPLASVLLCFAIGSVSFFCIAFVLLSDNSDV